VCVSVSGVLLSVGVCVCDLFTQVSIPSVVVVVVVVMVVVGTAVAVVFKCGWQQAAVGCVQPPKA